MLGPSQQNDQLFFRLCSDHVSIEAIPKKPILIDLERIKSSPADGYELMMWTPHFAVLKNPVGHEITLRKDGRMVIRRAGSEDAARQTAVNVLRSVLRDVGFSIKSQ